MSVEEIVLSLPEAAPGSDVEDAAANRRPNSGGGELVCRYRQMLEEKRRFAWTRRGRQRRDQGFDLACKSLAKQLARESTAEVEDRSIRLEARNRVYTDVNGLLSIVAMDQRRSALRIRHAVRYSLLLGILGTVSLVGLIYLSVAPQITL